MSGLLDLKACVEATKRVAVPAAITGGPEGEIVVRRVPQIKLRQGEKLTDEDVARSGLVEPRVLFSGESGDGVGWDELPYALRLFIPNAILEFTMEGGPEVAEMQRTFQRRWVGGDTVRSAGAADHEGGDTPEPAEQYPTRANGAIAVGAAGV